MGGTGFRGASVSDASRQRLPGALEVPLPPECKGWEELYPPRALFVEERREFDESRFWFQDAVHYAEPYYPFDTVLVDWIDVAFCQSSARLFIVPTSLGVEYRILGGYVYLSPNSVTDEASIARRADQFASRGGYYYEHWNELDRHWRDKVEKEVRALAALEVPELPDVEDEALVKTGSGVGSAHGLLVAYDQLLASFDRICHYHFELMNLGYGAYLALYEVCRQAFPDISDRTIAKMVAGIDVLALRPDDELKRLAARAVELGVASPLQTARGEQELRAALTGTVAGDRWLAEYQQAKDPWFYFSFGNGLYHHHRSWIDDPTLPITMIGSYARRLQDGEEIRRPRDMVLAERDRITREHSALLDKQTREAFDRQLSLARTVFPHIEDHNFLVDHRAHTVFWNKVREFGALLSAHAFLANPEDVFFLRHEEVRVALEELRLLWSSGGAGVPRGPTYWPPIISRRKAIYEALRRWSPPPALGQAPEEVTEPVTIMHWGITTERVHDWLQSAATTDGERLDGIAGSPGLVEGTARVILDVEQLADVKDGEILVARFTQASWTPVFARIAAAVTDAGGVMCHAAIVAREYRLPAVLGTGSATKRIATGDLIRVDADNGIVTILSRA
jgi:pyruvate, water dikinase